MNQICMMTILSLLLNRRVNKPLQIANKLIQVILKKRQVHLVKNNRLFKKKIIVNKLIYSRIIQTQ